MTEDPYLWLEDLEGERAAAWVRERNAATLADLAGGADFERLRAGLLDVLDAPGRIPYPEWHDGQLYNLWRDAEHPRGLWRRTGLDGYRAAAPDWEILIDLDALAAEEGENWVWQEVAYLRPDGRRCLVSLSRGGADASVVREFDLDARAFVPDGFTLPEARNAVRWIDADRVFVGTDFGPDSLTVSGYPRILKEWRRGTPLPSATTVFEGRPEDVIVFGLHEPESARDLVVRWLDFFRAERYLRVDGALVPVPVPLDADLDLHRDWALIRLRSPWTVGGEPHAGGTVLVTRIDDLMAGAPKAVAVFTPDEHGALEAHHWTRDHLVLSTLRDVRSRLSSVAFPPDGPSPLADGGLGHAEVVATNPDHSEEYLLSTTGFTEPTTLWYGRIGDDREALKREPSFFHADGIAVRQCFATSADGTAVPYFLIGRDLDTPGPTILNGYGGYEIPLTPKYHGVVGYGWLARGGTYAVANIRGGGEYGPRWHRAALRENRPRAYEDFAAVAADLVAHGHTTPERLGALGGSNGGLLMGAMLTRYPSRFGAIVAEVPLLDLKRYHLLLAGQSWVAEMGDPDDPDDWAYLRGFSPYHNVHSGQPYPPLLLLTSTRDDRVHPGHARKMAARLAEHGYDVSYYENVEGGHGAAADNRQAALKWALILEFFGRRLGLRH
jgi:prolyl oligopeptidase